MNPQNHHYRAAARRLYARDGLIEIERFAEIHDADHAPGVWIECLCFVSDAEALAEVEAEKGGAS